jgi:glycerol uptake facilitator-like aquaporin
MFSKDKVAVVVAEFLGGAILTLAVISMIALTSFPFFAATVVGLALGLLVLAVGRVSGAHANPAVTIGLWTLRKIETANALVYVSAQVLGGVIAFKIAEYLLNTSLKDLASGEFDWRVLTAEVLGTFVFTFGVASAVFQKFEGLKQAATIGTSLFLGVLVASLASNGVLNPAVAIGINSLNWSYVLGPILGGVVGMNTYALLMADSEKPSKAARRTKK